MHLYRTRVGVVLATDDRHLIQLQEEWDDLLCRDDLVAWSQARASRGPWLEDGLQDVLAPIASQEVWAAGVTYFRSRDARMGESKAAGGGDFYSRVYEAERPELFFKATPHRVVGSNQAVAIRSDARWSVPEPELTVLFSPSGLLIGYTIGNDVSSRDIEGENPLYLPQAKVYNRSCALGPGILLSSDPLPKETEIRLEIERGNDIAFEGSTTLASLKRDPIDLASYLFRDNSFPRGVFLLTGTGIVPPDSFTLQKGDRIAISIPPIGILINPVE